MALISGSVKTTDTTTWVLIHTAPCLPPGSHCYSLLLTTGRWPSWVHLGSWLYTKTVYLHENLNYAHCRATRLIETNTSPHCFKGKTTTPIQPALTCRKQNVLSSKLYCSYVACQTSLTTCIRWLPVSIKFPNVVKLNVVFWEQTSVHHLKIQTTFNT